MLSERGKQDDAPRSLRGFTRAPPFRRPARTPPTDWSGIHYLAPPAIRRNWHEGADPFIGSAEDNRGDACASRPGGGSAWARPAKAKGATQIATIRAEAWPAAHVRMCGSLSSNR